MANEARNMKKAGTGKSAIGLVLVAIGAIVLIGLAVWALTDPAIFEAVMNVVIFAVAAIVVIILIIIGIMFIMAIPMYAAKGEQYQDGVDYSLSDVKPVKESSSEDDKKED